MGRWNSATFTAGSPYVVLSGIIISAECCRWSLVTWWAARTAPCPRLPTLCPLVRYFHLCKMLQVESGDMVGRQDSATSTSASAALPQRRLPPLRRHPKRRAFTPTAEQVLIHPQE